MACQLPLFISPCTSPGLVAHVLWAVAISTVNDNTQWLWVKLNADHVTWPTLIQKPRADSSDITRFTRRGAPRLRGVLQV